MNLLPYTRQNYRIVPFVMSVMIFFVSLGFSIVIDYCIVQPIMKGCRKFFRCRKAVVKSYSGLLMAWK